MEFLLQNIGEETLQPISFTDSMNHQPLKFYPQKTSFSLMQRKPNPINDQGTEFCLECNTSFCTGLCMRIIVIKKGNAYVS